MADATESGTDLFVSYNRADEARVSAIAQALSAGGLSVFIDRDRLLPGVSWPQALESGLMRARAVAVFIGPGGLGEWQKREMYFALDRQVEARKANRDYPVIPVLLPNADITPGFLFLNTWVDLRRDDPLSAGLQSLIDGVRSASVPSRTLLPDVCPYRGLRAFREEDAPFFFGREAAVDATLRLLDRGVVGIVAGSGFGKSSVLMAGVIPRLRRQRPPGPVWDVAIFTPRTNPWLGLADAVLPLLEPDISAARRVDEAVTLAQGLSRQREALPRLVDRIIQGSRGTDRLLLGIDQFEEILTQVPAPDRDAFLEAVLGATTVCPLTVVLTLRADYYGVALGSSRPLADALNAAQVGLGPLTEQELRTTIEGPARLVGLLFEPGLVDAVLEDVQSQEVDPQRFAGSLPLLEYTLTALWQNRAADGLLTHAGYTATGGVKESISGRAEAIFAGQRADEQRATRQLFGRLVRVTRPDEEGADTRRRAFREELDDRAWTSAQQFAAPGQWLLVTGTDPATGKATVEVAHEALIRSWTRLREWLKEDRDFLLWRQQLGFLLGPWRTSGALLAPELVPEARHWLGQRKADLTAAEREFIEKSQAGIIRRRLPAWVGAAAALLAAVAVVATWIVQVTHVHFAVDFGVGDPLVVRQGAAWLSFLRWPGNRLMLDTGLHRDDVAGQQLLRLSPWDTNPALGRILLRDDVRSALADNDERDVLEFVVAADPASRSAIIAGVLARELAPADITLQDERDLYVSEMLRVGGEDAVNRVAAGLPSMKPEAGVHFIRALTGARAGAGPIDAAAQRAIGLALSRPALLDEAARALAADSPYVPGAAVHALPALVALLRPAAAFDPLVTPRQAGIARAIVQITTRAAQPRDESLDARLVDALLLDMERSPTPWADADAMALSTLVSANPGLAVRRLTLPQAPGAPAAMTLYARLLSGISAGPTRNFHARASLAVLGTIGAVRAELAGAIETRLLEALLRSEPVEPPGPDVSLANFLRGHPDRARDIFNVLSRRQLSAATRPMGVFGSAPRGLLRAMAATVAADRTLAPLALPHFMAALSDPSAFSDDTPVALAQQVRLDPASAKPLVEMLSKAIPSSSLPEWLDELLEALVSTGGADTARRLAPAVLPWKLARIDNYGPLRRHVLTAIVKAAPDTCATLLPALLGRLDVATDSAAETAISEVANGDSACADRVVSELLTRARANGGDRARRLLMGAADAANNSSYRFTDADWVGFADDGAREASVRILASTLVHQAATEADGGRYLLDQFDGRSIFTVPGANATLSAFYRTSVSFAVAAFLSSDDPRHDEDRRRLRAALETMCLSDARIHLRPAAFTALVEARRILQNRQMQEAAQGFAIPTP